MGRSVGLLHEGQTCCTTTQQPRLHSLSLRPSCSYIAQDNFLADKDGMKPRLTKSPSKPVDWSDLKAPLYVFNNCGPFLNPTWMIKWGTWKFSFLPLYMSFHLKPFFNCHFFSLLMSLLPFFLFTVRPLSSSLSPSQSLTFTHNVSPPPRLTFPSLCLVIVPL